MRWAEMNIKSEIMKINAFERLFKNKKMMTLMLIESRW